LRASSQIAGRLGLESLECSDPYVSVCSSRRFSDRAGPAQARRRVPRFSQHLLEMVYPSLPCAHAIDGRAEMQPNLSEGALADGFHIARGSVCVPSAAGLLRPPASIAPLTSDPMAAGVGGRRGHVFLGGSRLLRLPRKGKAALRLRLRAASGLTIDRLAIETCRSFRGGDEIAMRSTSAHVPHRALVGRPVGPGRREGQVMADAGVSPLGLRMIRRCCPMAHGAFRAIGWLQEYFAFQSVPVLQSSGLADAMRRAPIRKWRSSSSSTPRIASGEGGRIAQFALSARRWSTCSPDGPIAST